VIVEAETLTHARLLAVVNDLGRAAIDPDYEQMIPDDFIWRRLSRDEARDLLGLLRNRSRRSSARPNHAAHPSEL
jgi:hypothetical protein